MNKISVILGMLLAASLCLNEGQARHHHRAGKKSDALTRTCQGDECAMKAEHYALYSTIKSALETNFDIRGKDLYPFINSVELLKLRYDGIDADLLANNGSRLIREMLVSNELRRAMKIIQSPSGRSLADLYRTPTNGKEQNLACNKLRIDDIERASKMLEMDKELKSVFENIHRNFVRKSAKKCLKKACTSVDDSMSRLDSMVNRRHHHHYHGHHNNRHSLSSESSSLDDIGDRNPRLSDPTSASSTADSTSSESGREFSKQELELCNFFKRTNQSDCVISGSELSEISVIKATQLNELLASYANNKSNSATTSIDSSSASTKPGLKNILEQCEPMRGVMEHNLAAFKWYNKNELFSKQKFNARTGNCPRLSYWVQLDRLCAEIESVSRNGISPIERESITY